MIETIDINQKAVPGKKEATNYNTSHKLIYRKSFRENFVKKIKSISEQKLIGNS